MEEVSKIIDKRLIAVKYIVKGNVVHSIENKYLVDAVIDYNNNHMFNDIKRKILEDSISEYIDQHASQALYEHEIEDYFQDLLRQLDLD